ncbi:hypothetical protein EC912_104172 [Luteibacter rhizovicinus]|uniref:Uncharacterized protein n=1 Tax=Luteibacter rhizovicinus TaxID=242606 RepID=A0A4R3YNR6_9GAMM|nr:hypothetical protein [Luteibacter rhizovicinus]TCV93976.1 hypothetical protein EC912_104172 [Luteibacter rhizovicinus]
MQYPGKESPEFLRHHRLDTSGVGGRSGLTPLDGATRDLLHGMRWRKPPRDPFRFGVAFALALIFHIVLIFVVRYEMQPQPIVPAEVPVSDEDVLQVRLLDAPRPPPAAQVVTPPPTEPPPKVSSPEATRPAPKPVPHREAPAKDAMTATVEAPAPAPATSVAPKLNIYGTDGSITLTPETKGSQPKPDYVQPHPTGDSQIMEHKTAVKYTETRFEKDWAPRDENVINKGLRKAMEKTTVKSTMNLPGGARLHCSTVFFVLPVGCGGDPPPPPSKKDGDVRLNMAPANPLVKDLPDDPNAPPKQTEAQCIAAFRADKPLPQGCPSDTPIKAMDQENAERKRRTGG